MRSIKTLLFILLPVAFFSCQQNQTRPPEQTKVFPTSLPTETDNITDIRPKDQVTFLDRVQAESDYSVTSNSIQKDFHIEAFNKYAKDTLKQFKEWEFTVTEINDYSSEASTVSKLIGLDSNPLYNLVLVAPIKIDHSIDTIAIGNRVDFTYTIPKTPKGSELKKQLSVIKNLNKGDVVIISGALTHLDDQGKVNFASFYDEMGPWNVDLMVTEIRKRATN